MTFIDDMESDFKEILSAEFSEPGAITVPGFPAIVNVPVSIIFDQSFLEVGDDGAPRLSRLSFCTMSLLGVNSLLGRRLTEVDGALLTITKYGETFRLSEIFWVDSHSAEVKLNRK